MAFPNPSTGVVDLLLDFAEGTEVAWSLVDLSGRTAAKGTVESEGPMVETMDFSSLPKGMYILHVSTTVRHYTDRLILN